MKIIRYRSISKILPHLCYTHTFEYTQEIPLETPKQLTVITSRKETLALGGLEVGRVGVIENFYLLTFYTIRIVYHKHVFNWKYSTKYKLLTA